MKYVFFDIECANCFQGHGKICSFGYVITDEKFKILEKKDILINPHSKFHFFGRKNRPGIVLGYDEKTFNSSPDFNRHYKKIRELLTHPNRLVFGFSVMSDAGYIKSECERYHKEHFDYSFIDIQRIYTDYKGLDNTPSLIKCAHEYGVSESQEVHKSDDDSYFTMRVLKGMCEETGLTPAELIAKYPHSKCWCKNGEIGSEFLLYKEALKAQKLTKMEVLTGSLRSNWMHASLEKANEFAAYAKRVIVEQEASSPLLGKRVCISSLYEEYHFNEMMNIVSLLAKCGAKYTRHAYSCDVFVSCDIIDKNGKAYKCYRKDRALAVNGSEREILFLTIDELFAMLNTDKESLAALNKSILAPTKTWKNKWHRHKNMVEST